MLTPTTEEPKICHALATTSAFNLKLCLKSLELRHGWFKVTNPSTSRYLIKGHYCLIPFLPLVSIFSSPILWYGGGGDGIFLAIAPTDEHHFIQSPQTKQPTGLKLPRLRYLAAGAANILALERQGL